MAREIINTWQGALLVQRQQRLGLLRATKLCSIPCTCVRSMFHSFINFFRNPWHGLNTLCTKEAQNSEFHRNIKPSWGARISNGLTHWAWVMHVCVGNLTIISSDNGLSPDWRQAIIWTNAGMLLIGTNFNEIVNEIYTFALKKMHLILSSANWRPFYLGLNVLNAGSAYILDSNSVVTVVTDVLEPNGARPLASTVRILNLHVSLTNGFALHYFGNSVVKAIELLQSCVQPSIYIYLLFTRWCCFPWQINGLVQERCNSSALAMELRLSCTVLSKWDPVKFLGYSRVSVAMLELGMAY